MCWIRYATSNKGQGYAESVDGVHWIKPELPDELELGLPIPVSALLIPLFVLLDQILTPALADVSFRQPRRPVTTLTFMLLAAPEASYNLELSSQG